EVVRRRRSQRAVLVFQRLRVAAVRAALLLGRANPMSSRSVAFGALALAGFAALGSQLLSYGLVYPAQSRGQLPLVLSLAAGVVLAGVALGMSLAALRRAALPSERFLAVVSISLSCFFLFVVLFGFGIPNLFLAPG